MQPQNKQIKKQTSEVSELPDDASQIMDNYSVF